MTLSVDISNRAGDFELSARFDAPPGITALFGRSGAGKTTIVNAVAGLLSPDQGRIELDGTPLFDRAASIDLPPWRRRLGYVFQDGRLFPHMSVERNMFYGTRFAGGAKGPSLAEVADMLGITHLLPRGIAGLSGGEKQRVAVGRALLSRPRMLLMDEPLAALDGPRKDDILPYLERLRDASQLPILYVSHSVAEIARLATTIVLIEDGSVIGSGPAEHVLSDPDHVRHIGLREAGSVLPATVAAHHPDGVTELDVSGGRLLLPQVELARGVPVRVRILAQDVMLALAPPPNISALNILPVTVIALKDGLGPGVVVQLSFGSDRLLARVTRRSADALGLRPGLALHAVIKSVSVARTDIGTR